MFNKTFILSLVSVVVTAGMLSCEKEKKETDPEVTGITLNHVTLNLKTGENAMLIATVSPDPDVAVTWSSNNSSVAAVSNGQVVAGGIPGTALITAQAGNKSVTCTVTVTEDTEETYPKYYEVGVNIGIHTVTTPPSEKDPAPKEESWVQISGTLHGTAVVNRIDRLVNEPGYWETLTQQANVFVFTANSHFKIRDENDFSQIIYETRGPLEVNVKREEMDYIGEQYVKVYDFLSAGTNAKQAISLSILPYSLDRTLNIPYYIFGLEVLTYTEYIGDDIVGNGHSLTWNNITMQLEPSDDELFFGITGKKTSTDPGPEVTKTPLIPADEFNDYFLNPEGGTLVVTLDGKSTTDNSGIITRKDIIVKLSFRSIQDILGMPMDPPPPPPLEDWDWE